jgi:hypothetical protein
MPAKVGLDERLGGFPCGRTWFAMVEDEKWVPALGAGEP